jgi:hypothetical protein
MKASSITIDRKLKTVTIVMPLETARASKSGKTMLIATTKGLRTSTEQYARRPIFFTGNAFFYAANSANSGGGGAGSYETNDDVPRLKSRKHPQSVKVTKLRTEEIL